MKRGNIFTQIEIKKLVKLREESITNIFNTEEEIETYINLPNEKYKSDRHYKYHFSNCFFNCNLEFRSRVFKEHASFDSCYFAGTVDFRSVEFHVDANFRRTRFTDEVNFSNAKFADEVNFSEIKFLKEVYFLGTEFSGVADFSDTRFRKKVNFWGTKFLKKGNFIGADFDGIAYFFRLEFSVEANFKDVNFNGDTDFGRTKFGKKANFGKTNFKGEVNFGGAKFEGEAYFVSAEFSEETYFLGTKFNDKANFTGTKFYQLADFRRMKSTQLCTFYSAIFKEQTLFISADFNELNLGSAYFEKQIATLGIKVETASRDTFRLIKDAFLKDNNKLEALPFHAKEMKRYQKEIGSRLMGKKPQEKRKVVVEDKKENRMLRFYLTLEDLINYTPLWLNRYSNDFGMSWGRCIIFTIIAMAISLFISFFFRWRDLSFDLFVTELIACFDPTHLIDWVEDNTFTSYWDLGTLLFKILQQIMAVYGIYQTITAFRKDKM